MRLVPSQLTLSPSAWATKRSGTYVLAPTMNGATSSCAGWPPIDAFVEPICSATVREPAVALIWPL